MKTISLLPNIFKKIGWISLPFTLAFGVISYHLEFEIPGFEIIKKGGGIFGGDATQNFTNEVALSLFLINLIILSFSNEKQEDEFVNHIRLSSFQWAVLFNGLLTFTANWIAYGGAFFHVMIYCLFSTLIFYIARFNILLYRTKHEKQD